MTNEIERLECFNEGYQADFYALCPYPLHSYKHKEYYRGALTKQAEQDYPDWKCVYRKGTWEYRLYDKVFKTIKYFNGRKTN